MSRGTEAWGYATWGDPDSPGWAAKNIVTIKFCGRNVTVNKAARRHFKHLARIFRDKAPKYAAQIDDFLDDWGFNNRYIAGTTVKSNHSFGSAIDVDATKNSRNGGSYTDSAIWQNAKPAVLKAENHGFRWGGRYDNPDEMHFESLLTPEEIRTYFDQYGRLTEAGERKLTRHGSLQA